jgi:actin, other eukaryote
MLNERKSTLIKVQTARDIKEKLAFVALDFDKEIKDWSLHEKSYELPDGQVSCTI